MAITPNRTGYSFYNPREAFATQGEAENRDEAIALLWRALKRDLSNLELFDRYWDAVGPCQSGRYVYDAYRDAALASSVGVAAMRMAGARMSARRDT
jgi:hypothetical protein